MAQNQNIPRRLWKLETTHRGVATHSLRTTGLNNQGNGKNGRNTIDLESGIRGRQTVQNVLTVAPGFIPCAKRMVDTPLSAFQLAY